MFVCNFLNFQRIFFHFIPRCFYIFGSFFYNPTTSFIIAVKKYRYAFFDDSGFFSRNLFNRISKDLCVIELLCKESKADAYVIAKVDNKRGAQADTLAALFRKYTDRPVYREDTLADAFTRALNEKGSEGKLYCLGSLYLVGELKELIGGEDA